jgi:hypothetical protein
MALLMVALVNKFKPFGEVGGSNSEVGLDEKREIVKTHRKGVEKIAQERETKFQCHHSFTTFV